MSMLELYLMRRPFTTVRQAELRRYYQQDYDRLAFVYLGYQPEIEPLPEVAPPEDCPGLAWRACLAGA